MDTYQFQQDTFQDQYFFDPTDDIMPSHSSDYPALVNHTSQIHPMSLMESTALQASEPDHFNLVDSSKPMVETQVSI